MVNKIESKLHEIAKALEIYLEENKNIHLGLYTGKVGIMLFYAYYERYFNKKKNIIFFDHIFDECLNELNSEFSYPTFCDGLAGILFVFEHLKRYCFIDIDLTEAEKYYQTFLLKILEKQFEEKRYDFLHGGLGICYYFIYVGKAHYIIPKLIEYLEQNAELDEGAFKYDSVIDIYGNRACNISLAHGMSSIIIILTYLRQSDPKKIDYLLEKIITYILRQKLSSENAVSLYPSINLKNAEESSRLAWCYGDLGIGIALLRASMVTKNKIWYEKALEIFFHAVYRKEVKQTNIVDACFCHGTTGVAQLFKRAFTYTSKYKFLEANRYWIWKTLEIGQHASKPAGFELFGGIPENVYCLLDGIAGIGLTLLGTVGNNNYSRWDEAFLLS